MPLVSDGAAVNYLLTVFMQAKNIRQHGISLKTTIELYALMVHVITSPILKNEHANEVFLSTRPTTTTSAIIATM